MTTLKRLNSSRNSQFSLLHFHPFLLSRVLTNHLPASQQKLRWIRTGRIRNKYLMWAACPFIAVRGSDRSRFIFRVDNLWLNLWFSGNSESWEWHHSFYSTRVWIRSCVPFYSTRALLQQTELPSSKELSVQKAPMTDGFSISHASIRKQVDLIYNFRWNVISPYQVYWAHRWTFSRY
jgi:hypothetical protein